MNWRQRRAMRLRLKADRLDPGGVFVPVVNEQSQHEQWSVTWEECCGVTGFNWGRGVGAPLFIRQGDAHRLSEGDHCDH